MIGANNLIFGRRRFDCVSLISITEMIAPPIVLNNFDFMLVRYLWNYPLDGKDLDIRVGYLNTGTTWDYNYVGYGQGPTDFVPATSSSTDSYLWWAQDDTNPTNPDDGIESVVIGVKNFIIDNPGTSNDIEIGMYAHWWAERDDGNITLEISTYLGGYMTQSGTNIINIGGTQSSIDIVNTNITLLSQDYLPPGGNFQYVCSLHYNKLTDSAVVTF